MACLDFYHYTDEVGLQEIKLFGFIKASPLIGPDVTLNVEGVYGTPLPPTRFSEVVQLNSMYGYWQAQHLQQQQQHPHQRKQQQELTLALHVHIPADLLLVAPSNPLVFVYVGVIDLSLYHWEVIPVRQDVAQAPSLIQGLDSDYVLEEDSTDSEDDEETLAKIQPGEVYLQEEDSDEEDEEYSDKDEGNLRKRTDKDKVLKAKSRDKEQNDGGKRGGRAGIGAGAGEGAYANSNKPYQGRSGRHSVGDVSMMLQVNGKRTPMNINTTQLFQQQSGTNAFGDVFTSAQIARGFHLDMDGEGEDDDDDDDDDSDEDSDESYIEEDNRMKQQKFGWGEDSDEELEQRPQTRAGKLLQTQFDSVAEKLKDMRKTDPEKKKRELERKIEREEKKAKEKEEKKKQKEMEKAKNEQEMEEKKREKENEKLKNEQEKEEKRKEKEKKKKEKEKLSETDKEKKKKEKKKEKKVKKEKEKKEKAETIQNTKINTKAEDTRTNDDGSRGGATETLEQNLSQTADTAKGSQESINDQPRVASVKSWLWKRDKKQEQTNTKADGKKKSKKDKKTKLDNKLNKCLDFFDDQEKTSGTCAGKYEDDDDDDDEDDDDDDDDEDADETSSDDEAPPVTSLDAAAWRRHSIQVDGSFTTNKYIAMADYYLKLGYEVDILCEESESGSEEEDW